MWQTLLCMAASALLVKADFTPHFRKFIHENYGVNIAATLERTDLGMDSSFGGMVSSRALCHLVWTLANQAVHSIELICAGTYHLYHFHVKPDSFQIKLDTVLNKLNLSEVRMNMQRIKLEALTHGYNNFYLRKIWDTFLLSFPFTCPSKQRHCLKSYENFLFSLFFVFPFYLYSFFYEKITS